MSVRASIRVLIVDDSATARAAIRAALGGDPGIEIVGEAASGVEAIRMVRGLRPDLVTMDVYLAGTTGIDVTRAIMEECPTPILVITAYHPTDPGLAFKAVAAGALDVCAKLPSPRHADYPRERRRLIRLVRALAQVPVVRRYLSRSRGDEPCAIRAIETPARSTDLIAIGASTGGPPVVRDLLRALPAGLPVPVVLVQHMTSGFGDSYGKWLALETEHKVVYVSERAELGPATVYLAADNRHLRLVPGRRLVSNDEPAVNYQKPSIDVFFESVACELGARSAAVLLTGMGSDGAVGLASLRAVGALTIAQSPETCAIDSMPSCAIRRKAVALVLGPEAIAAELAGLERNVSPYPTAIDHSRSVT